MKKFILLFLSGVFISVYADTTENAAAANVEEVVVAGNDADVNEPENVVEIEVDDATAERIRTAVKKGEVFEEDGVVVVESKENDSILQIDEKGNEVEDSFVILPEKNAEKEKVFGKSMRAVMPDEVPDTTLRNILPLVEKAASEVFYFLLPYAAKTGAVLEDVGDEIARKVLGMKPKTAAERAEMHKRYDPYIKKGKEASRLRRMMVEFTEEVDDEVESASERRKRYLSNRKAEWRDDFAGMYENEQVAVVNIKNVIHYRRPVRRFHRKPPRHLHNSRNLQSPKREFRHQRKHRVHYLPPRMSRHHGKKMSKPIVFRNHKSRKAVVNNQHKKIKKVHRTKIKMYKKHHFNHAPKKMHRKSAPRRKR